MARYRLQVRRCEFRGNVFAPEHLYNGAPVASLSALLIKYFVGQMTLAGAGS